MKQFEFANWFYTGVLAFALLTPGWVQAMEFNSIVVFGGSVSDSGNFFALTGISNRPPYDQLDPFLVSTGPYSPGGHHFSNGATWIEQLGKALRLNKNVHPAFRGSSPYAANYAVGGARSTDVPDTVDMPEQVGTFLIEHGNAASPDALHVIDFGGNDVRDALAAALLGGDPNVIIGNALFSIASNVMRLYDAGARKFLFLNVADIGSIPSIQILDSQFPGQGIAAAATTLTVGFNMGLGAIIGALSLAQGAEVAVLDVFGTVTELIAHAGDYGLTEVHNACITPNIPPFSCKKPDQYLFWDGIHPTKAVHQIFADVAAEVLGQ